jgi:hypothetical protein
VARPGSYALFISQFVIAEASLGDPGAAEGRLAVLQGIPELEATEEVRSMGRLLTLEGPIPPHATIDAYHIAIATVNGMDYLLI